MQQNTLTKSRFQEKKNKKKKNLIFCVLCFKSPLTLSLLIQDHSLCCECLNVTVKKFNHALILKYCEWTTKENKWKTLNISSLVICLLTTYLHCFDRKWEIPLLQWKSNWSQVWVVLPVCYCDPWMNYNQIQQCISITTAAARVMRSQVANRVDLFTFYQQ